MPCEFDCDSKVREKDSYEALCDSWIWPLRMEVMMELVMVSCEVSCDCSTGLG